MKKKFYFMIPLTAFLAALAGCSSDEQEVNNEQQTFKAGDMIVSLEELTNDEDNETIATRSYLSRDMKTHFWTETDEMRVYDPIMIRYDIYKFGRSDDNQQKGVFSRISEQSNYSEEPAFAFFSNTDVEGGYFDRDRKTYEPYLMVRYRICADEDDNMQPMTYSSLQTGNTVYFADWLPRWGEVTRVDGGEALNTSMKFLTGVLRLQLTGTAGKADHLKVQMLEDGEPIDIAGVFSTKLSVNGVMQPNANLAADTYIDDTGGNEIIVDLTGATGSIVVYVPLVTTTTPVDIVVSASADGGSTYTEFKRFKNKTVTRGKVYGNSQEYDFANAG